MIKLELSIAEVNAVLQALGAGAYNQVADLIAKVREQAIPQVPAAQEAEKAAAEAANGVTTVEAA